MKEFGYFALAIMLWLLLTVWLDSLNPCSQFSEHPELCSSDGAQHIPH